MIYLGILIAVLERRAAFIEVKQAGHAQGVDSAKFLNYKTAAQDCEASLIELLEQDWLQDEILEDHAEEFAVEHLISPHLQAVQERELQRLHKENGQVQASLQAEIDYQLSLIRRYHRDEQRYPQNAAAYRGLRAQAERRKEELEERLYRRKSKINLQMRINSSGTNAVRVAAIVPEQLFR